MLQLFKKAKTEQQIVAEIHNEFDTAEDRLLEQADNLLAELNIPTETSIELKANKLEKLGFINAEPVSKAVEFRQHREKQKLTLVTTKEQAELIRYYKQTYPFQKFLTTLELERICQKYSLVFAPVKHYTKDVPDKNIKEIENSAGLKVGDMPKDLITVKVTDFWSSCPKDIRRLLSKEVDCSKYGDSKSESNLLQLAKDLGYKGEYKGYIFNSAEIKKTTQHGLFICAPQSHFNLDGLTKKGYGFLNVTTMEIKDPIVFRYCRGGVQVLSKWGLEGQDESLVNEKLN